MDYIIQWSSGWKFRGVRPGDRLPRVPRLNVSETIFWKAAPTAACTNKSKIKIVFFSLSSWKFSFSSLSLTKSQFFCSLLPPIPFCSSLSSILSLSPIFSLLSNLPVPVSPRWCCYVASTDKPCHRVGTRWCSPRTAVASEDYVGHWTKRTTKCYRHFKSIYTSP